MSSDMQNVYELNVDHRSALPLGYIHCEEYALQEKRPIVYRRERAWQWRSKNIPYKKTKKNSSAVRSRISSKLIFASCVGYFDRAF